MTALSDAVRALFEGTNIGHVATVLPDGSPHSVPVWVGVEGEHIAFLTEPTSRKARNLAHDPQVAISITDHGQPTTMAYIRGRVAERVEGEAAWVIIDRIAEKYTGQPYPLRTDRVVFLIAVARAVFHSYG